MLQNKTAILKHITLHRVDAISILVIFFKVYKGPKWTIIKVVQQQVDVHGT